MAGKLLFFKLMDVSLVAVKLLFVSFISVRAGGLR